MSRSRWLLVILALAAVPLAACAKQAAEESSKTGPASIQAIEGTNLNRVTLTADAAKRLGIATTAVTSTGVARAGTRLVVPYSAVIYDKSGAAWVFTTSQPLVFVRHAITIDSIEGDLAVLKTGPDVGTAIVTVGGAELFGVELGIGA